MVLPEAILDAARRGDVMAVRAWLDAEGDPDERTGPGESVIDGGTTLLHEVASMYDMDEQARCDIALLLLAHGAAIEARPENQYTNWNTPLFLAANHGKSELVYKYSARLVPT